MKRSKENQEALLAIDRKADILKAWLLCKPGEDTIVGLRITENSQFQQKWRNPKEWKSTPLQFHRHLQVPTRKGSKLRR